MRCVFKRLLFFGLTRFYKYFIPAGLGPIASVACLDRRTRFRALSRRANLFGPQLRLHEQQEVIATAGL